MNDRLQVPEAPPDALLFRRRVNLRAAAAEIWSARELVWTLAEREFRVRYKQAVFGVAWALFTPLVMMVAFTLVFPRVGNIDTQGAPYVLFSYVGLLAWTFFSKALAQGGISLVSNIPLLNKVYCPREVFPLASVIVSAMDTVIALSALAVLFAINGFVPKVTTLWVPLLALIQIAFTVGVTLLVSAIVVHFRDLRHALPLLLQLGLFATPVAYPTNDFVPERLQPLYALVNPLGPIIDGFRRVVLYGQPPDWGPLGLATLSTGVILVGGYAVFKRLETGMADVA